MRHSKEEILQILKQLDEKVASEKECILCITWIN